MALQKKKLHLHNNHKKSLHQPANYTITCVIIKSLVRLFKALNTPVRGYINRGLCYIVHYQLTKSPISLLSLPSLKKYHAAAKISNIKQDAFYYIACSHRAKNCCREGIFY